MYEEKLRTLERTGQTMKKLAGKQAEYRLQDKPATEGVKPAAKVANTPKRASDMAARLTAEDRQAKAWAEEHPSDPRAKEITKRLRAKVMGRD